MKSVSYLFIFSVFFLLVPNNSVAQNTIITPSIDIQKTDNSEWLPYFENNGLKIEFKYSECDPKIGFDNQSILLKFTNSSEYKAGISWQMHKYYDGVCNSCNYPEEYLYEIVLDSNSSLEGDCSIESIYQLKIFSKFIDENYTKGKRLTSFKLDDLKIIKK